MSPATHWRARADSPSCSPRIGERVVSPPVGQAEVHVQAVPAPVGQRLGHERQQEAPLRDHLAGHEPEQEDVVQGAERVAVAQGELELRPVVLGVDGFHREVALAGRGPDVVDQAFGVDCGAGAVHVGAGGVVRHPATRGVPLEDERFQLDPDRGLQTPLAPRLDGTLQRTPSAEPERPPLAFQVRHHHGGAGLPAGAHALQVEHRLHVRQALAQSGARGVQQGALVVHRVDPDAVPGRAGLGNRTWKVLPACEVQVVAEQDPDSFEFAHRESPPSPPGPVTGPPPPAET